MTPLGLLLGNTPNFTYEKSSNLSKNFLSLNLTTAKLQRLFISYKFSD